LGGLGDIRKVFRRFFCDGAALGLALSRFTLRELLRNVQVWLMALIGICQPPATLCMGYLLGVTSVVNLAGRFIPALLLEPHQLFAMDDQSQSGGGRIIYYAGSAGVLFSER
jgi:hypothetical protein